MSGVRCPGGLVAGLSFANWFFSFLALLMCFYKSIFGPLPLGFLGKSRPVARKQRNKKHHFHTKHHEFVFWWKNVFRCITGSFEKKNDKGLASQGF